ncbi:STAS domain-containing protein [Ornithinibacillus scapharcae]|uniref:STAS domain-containing protein n=1 Tax=Ornithinibacillus scapharcae TaxID=1147159 RepID=UPI000225B379|nr:STAS domain-containing protein [Ornithinibacillus scapharcae]
MSKQELSINIGGLDFDWELEKGLLQFENDDAVLFWIDSAMSVFLDAIEEISGEETFHLVLETTGFRQGLVVGKYFQNKDVSVSEAIHTITNTYAAAGWGRFTIQELDLETRNVVMDLKDSWESKVHKTNKKRDKDVLLPAHFAGIFTALLNTNMGYEVERYQLQGNPSSIVRYFPSNITVSDNIHRLARKKELEEIKKLESLVQEKTRELEELVQKLSSPIIPVLDGIVVIPLLGKYEEKRAEELVKKVLNNIPNYDADYLVLDVTGLDADINESTIRMIDDLRSGMPLIGLEIILVGISPKLSREMVNLGIDMSDVNSFHSLQHGIYHALGEMGRNIDK